MQATTINARDIVTGTGSGPESADNPAYRWARLGCWRVRYWPNGGGAQGYIDVNHPDGLLVDVHDEMPHEVWIALLEAVGAPVQ